MIGEPCYSVRMDGTTLREQCERAGFTLEDFYITDPATERVLRTTVAEKMAAAGEDWITTGPWEGLFDV